LAVARHGNRGLAASVRTPDRGGTRQRERAVEARRVVFEPQHAFAFDRERMIGRVDAEPHLHRTVVAHAARADAIAVAFAGGEEPALTFRRPKQRAHLAFEPETLQRGLRTARAVGQAQASILDFHFLDLETIRLETELRRAPVELPVGADAERNIRAGDAHFGGADFAAHQRAQCQFDVQFARARLRLHGGADLDLSERERGRRQETQVDRAADAHRLPDELDASASK
jgi:hypothetical protein